MEDKTLCFNVDSGNIVGRKLHALVVSCLKGYMYMCNIVPIILSEPFYPLQYGGTPLSYAAEGGHTTCVEHLLSTPGIDVNIKSEVSWS